MKLYATTTSERASKGQGGEWIDITLQDENKATFAVIRVRAGKNPLMPSIEIEPKGQVRIDTAKCTWGGFGMTQCHKEIYKYGQCKEHYQDVPELKGEKQKGDTCDMENCTREATEGKYCHSCAKTV